MPSCYGLKLDFIENEPFPNGDIYMLEGLRPRKEEHPVHEGIHICPQIL